MALHDGNPMVTLHPDTYDRFCDGYVALTEVLIEARRYVANSNWPSATQRDLLDRIDAALAMKANLEKPIYTCSDCGWQGGNPTILEHPRNEFPNAYACPNCGKVFDAEDLTKGMA
jgi:ssDNA-binding Zn-finger/Zn-ribbon topoisomerase 1